MTIVALIFLVVVRAVNTQNERNGNGLSYNEIENIDSTVCNELITCSICLENIEIGTVVKVLPTCFHKFHQECIDRWLFINCFCPYCRASVIPDPGR